jgi:hypothetical protein
MVHGASLLEAEKQAADAARAATTPWPNVGPPPGSSSGEFRFGGVRHPDRMSDRFSSQIRKVLPEVGKMFIQYWILDIQDPISDVQDPISDV